MTIGDIGNPKFIEKLKCVMPHKPDNKKNLFLMSFTKLLLKYGLRDNHWVGQSVMKPVDAVVFQKIRAIKAGKN